MNLIVSDASPIRYLVAIDVVHILSQLFSKVIIPSHVIATELQSPRTPHKVRAWASHPPAWVEVRSPAKIESLNLHRGEEQAIALALELKSPVLLDEREAREVAKRLGLSVIGTIGVIEQAALRNLINLEHTFAALQQTNIHVHRSLIEAALKRWKDAKPIPFSPKPSTE